MLPPEGWHPVRYRYGVDAVAPMLLRQNTLLAEPVKGQLGGGVRVPRWQASAQMSGGVDAHVGAVPVQGGGGGQGIQEMFAAHPASDMEKSESKMKVRQPLLAVTVPGETVPEYVPITGNAEEGPS